MRLVVLRALTEVAELSCSTMPWSESSEFFLDAESDVFYDVYFDEFFECVTP